MIWQNKVRKQYSHPKPQHSNCKTKYNINGEEGTLAVIGPKRMEYDRVVSLLDYIKENIGGNDEG